MAAGGGFVCGGKFQGTSLCGDRDSGRRLGKARGKAGHAVGRSFGKRGRDGERGIIGQGEIKERGNGLADGGNVWRFCWRAAGQRYQEWELEEGGALGMIGAKGMGSAGSFGGGGGENRRRLGGAGTSADNMHL